MNQQNEHSKKDGDMSFGDLIVCSILGFLFTIFSLEGGMLKIVTVEWKKEYFRCSFLCLPALTSLFSIIALLKYDFFNKI